MTTEIIDSNTIVAGLSQQIGGALRAMEMERHHPGLDPDRMDDTIKFYRERANTLRAIRESYENEMARPAP